VSVLVVDDDADAREVVSVALQQCGADVVTATSANEAFDALKRHSPHVLLVDIAMPGEDGYSLIEKVRALPSESRARVPAAALTAHARPEDKERALQAGFDLHLTKPLDVRMVCRAVADLAVLRRPSQA
jgi:CheY-like chemotaxis protein